MRLLVALALSGALASGCGSAQAVGGPVGTDSSGVEIAAMKPSAVPAGSDAGLGGIGAGVVPLGGPGATAVAGFGHPVYTQAEIDSWSTGSAEFTRLANSWAGNVNRAYAAYGSEISSVERDLFRDESVYLKVQAVLWAADGNAARRDKVVARLNELRGVTSFQWDSVEQYRLVAGWAATDLAQAAAIVGYSDPGFRRFLVQVCYPILDWTAGPNWHASFADSKLAIAAYVGDAALWADAKAYFYRRIAQQIYHAAYDGGKISPLLNANGAPSVGNTLNHWGAGHGAAQINSDFTAVQPSQFPNGTYAERTRDLAHVSMGLGALRTPPARSGRRARPWKPTRTRGCVRHTPITPSACWPT